MKKFILLLVALLAILMPLVISNFISKEILESFKTVDNSLIKSIDKFGKPDFEILYDSIQESNITSPMLIKASDTIYLRTNHIVKFVDSVKDILATSDTSGTNLLVSQRLLMDTQLGSQLYRNLVFYNEFAKVNITNRNNHEQLKFLHFNYPHYYSENKWLEISFKNTPTVASKAILSKIKSECYQIGILMLKELSSNDKN